MLDNLIYFRYACYIDQTIYSFLMPLHLRHCWCFLPPGVAVHTADPAADPGHHRHDDAAAHHHAGWWCMIICYFLLYCWQISHNNSYPVQGLNITFLRALDELNFNQDKNICLPNVRQAIEKIQCVVIFPWTPGAIESVYHMHVFKPYIHYISNVCSAYLCYVHICTSIFDSVLSVQISDNLFGNRTHKNQVVFVKNKWKFKVFFTIAV